METSFAGRLSHPADLLAAHRPLILSLVRAQHVPVEQREDAEQGAALGFLIAHQRFDGERGVPIGAYARSYMQQEIRRATGWGRGAPPTTASIEGLDFPSDDDPTAELDLACEHAAVRRVVSSLSANDRQLFKRLFVDEISQGQLAKELGLSPMQLSRTKRAFLSRVRRLLEREELVAA